MLFNLFKRNNKKVESSYSSPIEGARIEYEDAESNYNNAITVDQQTVCYFRMQAAKARLDLIVNEERYYGKKNSNQTIVPSI